MTFDEFLTVEEMASYFAGSSIEIKEPFPLISEFPIIYDTHYYFLKHNIEYSKRNNTIGFKTAEEGMIYYKLAEMEAYYRLPENNTNIIKGSLSEMRRAFFYTVFQTEKYGPNAPNNQRIFSIVKKWDQGVIDFREHIFPLNKKTMFRGDLVFYNYDENGNVIEKRSFDLIKEDSYLIFILRERVYDMLLVYHETKIPAHMKKFVIVSMDLAYNEEVRHKTVKAICRGDSYDVIPGFFNYFNLREIFGMPGHFIENLDVDSTTIVFVTVEPDEQISYPPKYVYHICKDVQFLHAGRHNPFTLEPS